MAKKLVSGTISGDYTDDDVVSQDRILGICGVSVAGSKGLDPDTLVRSHQELRRQRDQLLRMVDENEYKVGHEAGYLRGYNDGSRRLILIYLIIIGVIFIAMMALALKGVGVL